MDSHIYEIGETGGLNFIAMEFIEGVTLREKIYLQPYELQKLLRLQEEWSRGAYAWFRPGELTELLPHIAKPEGRVHFAGDHTSPWPGWMQGALQSGNRAAREVNQAR